MQIERHSLSSPEHPKPERRADLQREIARNSKASASCAVTSEAVERLLDDRVRQGLPRTITDPAVLARVATILRAARRKNAA